MKWACPNTQVGISPMSEISQLKIKNTRLDIQLKQRLLDLLDTYSSLRYASLTEELYETRPFFGD